MKGRAEAAVREWPKCVSLVCRSSQLRHACQCQLNPAIQNPFPNADSKYKTEFEPVRMQKLRQRGIRFTLTKFNSLFC